MDDGLAVTLVFWIRPARRRAGSLASAEAAALLEELGGTVIPGGPFSDRGGVFWMGLPPENLPAATDRLPRLGYSEAVDCLEPLDGPPPREDSSHVRWRHHWYRIRRLWTEDPAAHRDRSPDRRTFLLETADGVVRPVTGYRGDGGDLSRRGLPVCDARLLVNLSCGAGGGRLLDPFAGIGGIILEAAAAGCETVSCDVDPALRHGLAALAKHHCVADAEALPFPSGCFDAVATEPPYHSEAIETVAAAVHEIARVLKPGGRLAMMAAGSQAERIRTEALLAHLESVLDTPVDRKGLETVVICWRKAL